MPVKTRKVDSSISTPVAVAYLHSVLSVSRYFSLCFVFFSVCYTVSTRFCVHIPIDWLDSTFEGECIFFSFFDCVTSISF